MTKRSSVVILTCLLLSLTGSCYAADKSSADKKDVLTLESIRIHGDQESPVVVYIVPWQPPEQKLLDVQQANAVLRPLEPLERESFQRMLGYHQLFQLQAGAEKQSAQ